MWVGSRIVRKSCDRSSVKFDGFFSTKLNSKRQPDEAKCSAFHDESFIASARLDVTVDVKLECE